MSLFLIERLFCCQKKNVNCVIDTFNPTMKRLSPIQWKIKEVHPTTRLDVTEVVLFTACFMSNMKDFFEQCGTIHF